MKTKLYQVIEWILKEECSKIEEKALRHWLYTGKETNNLSEKDKIIIKKFLAYAENNAVCELDMKEKKMNTERISKETAQFALGAKKLPRLGQIKLQKIAGVKVYYVGYDSEGYFFLTLDVNKG